MTSIPRFGAPWPNTFVQFDPDSLSRKTSNSKHDRKGPNLNSDRRRQQAKNRSDYRNETHTRSAFTTQRMMSDAITGDADTAYSQGLGSHSKGSESEAKYDEDHLGGFVTGRQIASSINNGGFCLKQLQSNNDSRGELPIDGESSPIGPKTLEASTRMDNHSEAWNGTAFANGVVEGNDLNPDRNVLNITLPGATCLEDASCHKNASVSANAAIIDFGLVQADDEIVRFDSTTAYSETQPQSGAAHDQVPPDDQQINLKAMRAVSSASQTCNTKNMREPDNDHVTHSRDTATTKRAVELEPPHGKLLLKKRRRPSPKVMGEQCMRKDRSIAALPGPGVTKFKRGQSHLKSWIGEGDESSEGNLIKRDREGKEQYELERIVNSRDSRGSLQYKAHFANSSKWNRHPPWQPAEDFNEAAYAVADFHYEHPDKAGPLPTFERPYDWTPQ